MMTSEADLPNQNTLTSEKPAPVSFADKLEAFSQEKFASFRAAVSSPNLLGPEKAIDTPDEQDAKVKALREAIGRLAGRAKIFCTDDCLRRYLRARNWNVSKAEKMLRDTLRWRHRYRPEEITWDDVASEAATGKVYRTEFLDKKGRAVVVMSAGRQNTSGHEGQVRHLVYALENAINHLPAGTHHMVWFIDFRGWTLRKAPPLKTSREVLNILQNHYPERLGQAVVYDPPPVFETFWKMIRPFVDPNTFKKILFVYPSKRDTVTKLEEIFDPDRLDGAFGGRSTWAFDLPAYSQTMQADDAKARAFWGISAAPSQVAGSGRSTQVPAQVPMVAGAEGGEAGAAREGCAEGAADGRVAAGEGVAVAGADAAGEAGMGGQEAGALLSEAESGGRSDEGYSVTVGGVELADSPAEATTAAAAAESPEQEREEGNGCLESREGDEREQDGSFWLPLNEPPPKESIHAQNIAAAHNALKSTFSKISLEFKKPTWMQPKD